ncbi:ragulator complex protein LAMTOR1-like [Littorina saxatilis]|uniref:Ragulator complex protein LAMTOR1 n=1 Tax=Littorina saxatilis TaxID=31220 RepID=A0AAN9G6F7_9CAEN
MGCCFSSDEDKDTGFPDPDERTRLLDPNHGNAAPPSHNNRSGQQYTQESEKGDEQSAMARILHQNARDVIDVASNETTIEQHEYHDRARQYNTRLKMVLANSGKQGTYKIAIPNGITAPQSVLAAPPVSPAEIQLICNASEKFSKAMRDGVRIQHREDLVVSFGVPVP